MRHVNEQINRPQLFFSDRKSSGKCGIKMAIDICKTNRTTRESEFVPICTAIQYRELWQPAIVELNLPMLNCLPALEVTSAFKDQFLSELRELRSWALSQQDDAHIQSMLESLDMIRSSFETTDLDHFEISFG